MEIYSEPVHEPDGNGNWVELNNEMEETLDPSPGYLCQRINSQVFFWKEIKSMPVDDHWQGDQNTEPYAPDNMICFRNRGYQLSWRIESAFETTGSKEAFGNGMQKKDHIVYPDILPETDLSYRMRGLGVKGDFILKSPLAPDSYTLVYCTEGLTAKIKEEENAVVFSDPAGKEAFRVCAPFMRDSKGALSRRICVKMEMPAAKETIEEAETEEIKDTLNEVRITFLPDREWLLDPCRVFPIVIDPVTITPLATTDIFDTYADCLNVNTTHYQWNWLETQGHPDYIRSFIQFTLPQIQPADMITSARMNLFSIQEGEGSRTVSVHRICQPFDSITLDWRNAPVYDENIEDLRTFTGDHPKQVSFDITRLVKDWYAGIPNYGLMLKDYTELGPLSQFHSSETDTYYYNNHPVIQISYVNYSGLEDFWSYHSQDAGRAGIVHVNDYSGNLIACHTAASTGGSIMPMDLSLYYNSNEKTKNLGYGLGWRLNCHQSIFRIDNIPGAVYYRHIEGDGTVHYFYFNSEKNKWLDEMDPKKELELAIGSGEPYVITDAGHNQLVFDQWGYLIKAKDRNGNELTVTWNTQQVRVSSVTDGVGRTATLTYHTDPQGHWTDLASITSPAGTKYFTMTGHRLTGITDIDGAVMSYGYNSSAFLSSIQGPDGIAYEYAYDTGGIGKIRKITQRGSDGVQGQTLSFSYGYNRTTFTDREGRSVIFRFNHAGCLLQVSDGFGHACAAEYIDSGAYRNRLSCATRLQASTVQLLKDPCMFTAGDAASVWQGISTANVTASVNTAQVGIMAGSRSLKLQASANGPGYWKQDVTVEKGVNYTFSMYVKAAIDPGSDGTGVYLRVAYPVGGGAFQQAYSHFVRCTTADFIRLYCVFRVPLEAPSDVVSLCFCMNNVTGTAYADMAQLEKSSTPSRCNLIDNGSFSDGSTEGFDPGGAPEDGICAQGETVYIPVRKSLVTKTACTIRETVDSSSSAVASVAAGGCLCSLGEVRASDNTLWHKVQDTVGHKGYLQDSLCMPFLAGSRASMNGVISHDDVTLYSSPSDSNSIIQEDIQKGHRVAIKSIVTGPGSGKWFYCGILVSTNIYYGYLKAQDVVRLASNDMSGQVTVSGGAPAYFIPSPYSYVVRNIPYGTSVSLRGYVETPSGVYYAVLSGQNITFLREDDITIGTEAMVTPVHAAATPDQPGGFPRYLYHFTGDPAMDKRLTKHLQISGSSGDVYMVNAWGYGSSLPMPEVTPRRFGVKVSFVAPDGTKYDHEVNFSQDLSDWQFLGEAFAARNDYRSIEVSYQYCHQAGHAWVTGLSLYREEYGQSYTYDDDGNLTSASDILKEATGFDYSQSQDLTGLTDPRGNRKAFVYDSRHNVTNAVSPMNVRTRLTYDSLGNIIRSGVYDPSSVYTGTWIDRTFTSNGNHVAQVTDAAGQTTSYTWDLQKDRLLSLQDPAGNTTAYTYDPLGRMTMASFPLGPGQAATVSYQYENDRLKRVTHNGVQYQFSWDAYSNIDSICIGGNEVVSYSYGPNNGNLLSKNYANGSTIRFHYDQQDRVTEVYLAQGTGTGQKLFSYAYDREGFAAKITDHSTGKSWRQFYDMTGRLCQSQCSDGGHYIYLYDPNGNVKSMSSVENGTQVRMLYTYDKDNRETRVETGGLHRVTAYDAFDRPTSRRWRDLSDTDQFSTVYIYDDTAPLHRHGLVKSIRNNGLTTSYEYDSRYNISRITFPDGKKITYVYDALCQLVRENSEVQNRTFTYEYDTGGNMTSLKEYSYTTGNLPASAIREITGEYRLSGWKDQLIRWDNHAISYDASGNMLTYGSGSSAVTYSWTRGRLLASVSQGSSTIASYEYNDRGLRLKKTSASTVTYYSWAGNLLTALKKGTEIIHFFYDSDGALLGLQLNGIKYYYVRNATNDIIGIVDDNGDLLVEYAYDSWGNPIYISDSSTSGIGNKNPFRYKGYYWDADTGLYYIDVRYYNPELFRFISPDDTSNLGKNDDFTSTNFYLYCANNPTGRVDVEGEAWLLAFALAGAVIGIATQYTCNVAINLLTRKTLKDSLLDAIPNSTNWAEYTSAAISGALSATGISTMGSVAVNATLGGFTYLADCEGNNVEANPVDFFLATTAGAVAGLASGPGIDSSRLEGVYNTSKTVIEKSISPKKIALYNSKIISGRQSITKGVKAIIKSGVAGNSGGFFRKWVTKSVV